MLSLLATTALAFFEPEPLEGSDSSKEQNYQKIYKDLLSWGKSSAPTEIRAVIDGKPAAARSKFLKNLNRMLQAQGLPLIQESANLKINRTCVIGIVLEENCFSGLSIEDGVNRFCFPCDKSHNSFVVGIRSADYKEKSTTGPVYQNKPKIRQEGRN